MSVVPSDQWIGQLGKNIALVGSAWEALDARYGNAPLLSSANLCNFDVLALNNATVNEAVAATAGQADWASRELSAGRLNLIVRQLTERLGHLLDLCEAGATVVVFLNGPLAHLITKGADPFGLGEFPLFDLAPLRSLHGHEVSLIDRSSSDIGSLLERVTINYSAALSGASLTPLLIAPAKDRTKEAVVAAYVRPTPSSGVILFCPSYANTRPRGSVPNHQVLAFRSWIEIAIRLSAQSEAPRLPGWVAEYNLSKEHRDYQTLLTRKVALTDLQNEVAGIERDLEEQEWLKHLVVENDTPLENAVARVFTALGAKVEPGPKHLADLLISFSDTLICAEVKGYEGGTKEVALVQCQRWISEVTNALLLPASDEVMEKYAVVLKRLGLELPLAADDQELPIRIKGLIVANTYRKDPIGQRPDFALRLDDHFPQRLQRKMEAAKIAGITGLQLLGLYDQARRDTSSRDGLVASLISTDGVSALANDWKLFLMTCDTAPEN